MCSSKFKQNRDHEFEKEQKELGGIRHRGGFGVWKGKREMVQIHDILKTKRRRDWIKVKVDSCHL